MSYHTYIQTPSMIYVNHQDFFLNPIHLIVRGLVSDLADSLKANRNISYNLKEGYICIAF